MYLTLHLKYQVRQITAPCSIDTFVARPLLPGPPQYQVAIFPWPVSLPDQAGDFPAENRSRAQTQKQGTGTPPHAAGSTGRRLYRGHSIVQHPRSEAAILLERVN